jgi:hypothetical protein
MLHQIPLCHDNKNLEIITLSGMDNYRIEYRKPSNQIPEKLSNNPYIKTHGKYPDNFKLSLAINATPSYTSFCSSGIPLLIQMCCSHFQSSLLSALPMSCSLNSGQLSNLYLGLGCIIQHHINMFYLARINPIHLA